MTVMTGQNPVTATAPVSSRMVEPAGIISGIPLTGPGTRLTVRLLNSLTFPSIPDIPWELEPLFPPYEGNKVRLEVDDLPLDADITTAEVETVPYDRSGMTIDFPLARRHQATALLQAADGSPLPIGLRLRSADGTVTAWVARDGFTQVNGALPAAIPVMGGDDSASVTCELPAAEGEELLPDLGTIRCR
jgi:hypothetical protein